LLGGSVAEYCGGEPKGLYDRRHEVPSTQGEGTLHSVVERYRRTLSVTDPAASAVLERLCLFRMGASAAYLARMFLGKGRSDSGKRQLSGAALARLSIDALQVKLSGLAQMRLILESEEPGGIRYSVHPALRDTLVPSIAPGQQVRIHRAVLADAGVKKDADDLP